MQMDAQERVKSPRSMYPVHGSSEVAAEDSSAVGVVASCSEGTKASSTGEKLLQLMSWRQILVVVPKVPLSLRGSVRIGISEVLLHWCHPTCGSDRAQFLPSSFIMRFYKVSL
jgi:hypothetical protein